MARILTLDLGTTLYKVALFDDAGNLLALERSEPPIQQPQPGWMTLDPDDFLETLAAACTRLRLRTGGDWSDVAAVSYATQANSFTLLDDSGDATHALILWPDQRAVGYADELTQISARIDHFPQSTGMPQLGPMLALAKLLWLRREQPQWLERARRLCFLSDFLTAYLTGRSAPVEAGVAALSGALDIASLHWRRDILEALHVPPVEMPSVARAGTDLGALCPPIARELGLPASCRFIVGCLDQYAGAIGTATVHPGQLCETTGTVLAAVRCSDRIERDAPAGVYQGPSFSPRRFYQMRFSSTSANILDHYRRTLADRPAFDELSRAAGDVSDDQAVAIDRFDGRGSIAQSLRHVSPQHSAGQVARGIMRRVAMELKQHVMSLAPDQQPAEIRCAGGGARSDTWLQIKADLLGIRMVRLDCEEPTSLGAAILAGAGLGMGSVSELAQRWVRPAARFEPQKKTST